jgi:5-deoxy-D-glucuronate isomerase
MCTGVSLQGTMTGTAWSGTWGEATEKEDPVEMKWGAPYVEKHALVLVADKREDLFLDKPKIHAYVKDRNELAKHAWVAGAEFVLSIGSGLFKIKEPGPVEISRVQGRGSDQLGNQRTVFEFWGPEHGDKIRVGFTQHDYPGTWSSWPPHDFEVQELLSPVTLYPDFCERFAYVFEKPDQWGIQTQMRGHGNLEMRVIKDKDIGKIDIGVHPLVAMPGARLSYFWVYANGGEKFEEEHA